MSPDIFTQLKDSLIDGDPEAAVELTKLALAAGEEPMTIIRQGLMPGMDVVGQKFSDGEYFLPDLIIAAEGMKNAMALLEPELRARHQTLETAGIVVIGTVKGDIHEIGKSLVATMLSANGFTVYDLGVDVPKEAFIAKIQETGANILGMSALLTTTMTQQREVIKALEAAGLRAQVKVMVGGAPVTKGWAEEIGADDFAEDAMSAVQKAKNLVGKG
jgi:corrinoid protein of di/trimethylamine methyltransferase